MEKAQCAYNRHLWLPLLVLVTTTSMTAAFAEAKEWELFAIGLMLSLFFVFVICIQPFKVAFGKNEIRIIYVIGVRDVIPMNRITSVYEQGGWGSAGWPVYVICYQGKSGKPFFQNGEIPRTSRTKKILRERCLIGQGRRKNDAG